MTDERSLLLNCGNLKSDTFGNFSKNSTFAEVLKLDVTCWVCLIFTVSAYLTDKMKKAN